MTILRPASITSAGTFIKLFTNVLNSMVRSRRDTARSEDSVDADTGIIMANHALKVHASEVITM